MTHNSWQNMPNLLTVAPDYGRMAAMLFLSRFKTRRNRKIHHHQVSSSAWSKNDGRESHLVLESIYSNWCRKSVTVVFKDLQTLFWQTLYLLCMETEARDKMSESEKASVVSTVMS